MTRLTSPRQPGAYRVFDRAETYLGGLPYQLYTAPDPGTGGASLVAMTSIVSMNKTVLPTMPVVVTMTSSAHESALHKLRVLKGTASVAMSSTITARNRSVVLAAYAVAMTSAVASGTRTVTRTAAVVAMTSTLTVARTVVLGTRLVAMTSAVAGAQAIFGRARVLARGLVRLLHP